MNFEKAYQSLPPGAKILVMRQFSYMPDQILGKNEKRPKFDFFFKGYPLQNITTYSKNFVWPNVFGYRLGIAKISFTNFISFWRYLEKPRWKWKAEYFMVKPFKFWYFIAVLGSILFYCELLDLALKKQLWKL